MTDIEVKRKELETAKRIRDNRYECTGKILVRCLKDEYCPCSTGGGGCRHWRKSDWDAFISTREAELAALENTPQNGLSHVQTAIPAKEKLWPRAKGATGPSIDDFALALIQGGYYKYGAPGELYDYATKIKAESDRRRRS